MLARQPAKEQRSQSYRGPIRLVTTPARLSADPNLLIQIGSSADGLPLLLDIYRGKDLSEHFARLAEAVASPWHPAPEAELSTFRRSLEQFATKAWASERMHPVIMKSGSTKTLYVSSFTLVEPFSSVLAGLLRADREQPLGAGTGSDRPRHRDTGSPARRPPECRWPEDRATEVVEELRDASSRELESSSPEVRHSSALQSVGGRNRFLGISDDDSGVYSVGKDGNEYVEWRPFHYENILGLLPDAEFEAREERRRNIPGLRPGSGPPAVVARAYMAAAPWRGFAGRDRFLGRGTEKQRALRDRVDSGRRHGSTRDQFRPR
jgi:hypothetical protein